MALTLVQATALRDAYYAAALAVATGQEYEIGNRRLTRADAAEINRQLAYYDALVDALESDSGRGVVVKRIVFRDL